MTRSTYSFKTLWNASGVWRGITKHSLYLFFIALLSGRLLNWYCITTSTGVNDTLECMDYRAVEMVNLFLAVFIKWVAGYFYLLMITTAHIILLDLVNCLMLKPCGLIGARISSYHFEENHQKLKMVAERKFGNLEETTLFTVKFHMINDVVENESRFELFAYLDVLYYKSFKFINEKFVGIILVEQYSILRKTVIAWSS